ncbi:TonB-dependent receptor [Bordetella trematum]|uniref:TonB-dependent receptor n=1 Tax=Bordetella trematum TaxID=123899 RepID=UPI0015C55FE3|nr:TonB-dependent receptor [Bordetella trematum]
MAPVSSPCAKAGAAPLLARCSAATLAALLLGLTLPAQTRADEAAHQRYAIAAAPLSEALTRFAEQAGITLLYEPSAVAGLHSPGLQGDYSPEQALQRLLAGSPLNATRQAGGAYVLRPGVPLLQPIPVEGRLPRQEPAWVSTISRQTLDAAMARSWSDVGKRLEPGVAFNRQNNSLNIRGLDQDRVVARIDGIRLPFLDDGARGVKGGLDAVDFNSLSRLDIVRGLDSAKTGSGALGGVAELRTLEPDDLLTEGRRFGGLAKLDYDSADTSRSANAALAGRVHDDTSWLLQAGARRGHALDNRGDVGGYGAARSEPTPERYRQEQFLAKVQQRIDGGHRIGLTGEYFKRTADLDSMFEQGAGTSYLYGENSTRKTAKRERLSLDYQYAAPQAGGLIDNAKAVIYWQRLTLGQALNGERGVDARANAIPGDPFRYGYPNGAFGRDNTIRETRFGASGEVTRQFDGAVTQRLTLGGEWIGNRSEQYSDGYDNCPPIPPGLPAPMGPRACDILHTNQADMPRVKGSQFALWVQDEFGFDGGRYTLTPSLRYDHYEQKPQGGGGYDNNSNAAASLPAASSGGRFSPRLLGTWKAREQLTLYAQYGFAYRAPNASELYTNYGGPGTYLRVGNPTLKAETSKGWELGAKLGDDTLGGSVAAFDNRYQNFIDKGVPLDPASPHWQPGWNGLYPMGVTGTVNRDRVRIYGAEASAHWSFAPGWRSWASLAWAVGKDQSTGRHVNSVPPLKAIVGLGYSREQWGVQAQLTAARQRDRVEYGASAANPDFRAPGYGVTDLMAYWRPTSVKGLQWQLGIFNLFDKKYWEAINVPTAGAMALPRPADWYTEPGRSARLSLTYQF